MKSNDSPSRVSADERFKRMQKQRTEASKAMSEYHAAARAEDAKTARLRALRLARDAATGGAAPVPVPAATKAKKGRSSRA